MELEKIKLILEIISLTATIIGLPAAIYYYVRERKKERVERENNLYDSLDQWYTEFLKISFENRDLAALYYGYYLNGKTETVELTEDQKIRQLLYFEILTSILERAYLIYKDHSTEMKKKRWKGWDEYTRDWMSVPYYRETWVSFLGSQWDEEFQEYMNAIRIDIENKV